MLNKLSELKEKYLPSDPSPEFLDSDEVRRRLSRSLLVSGKKVIFRGLKNSDSARRVCSSFTCSFINEKQAATGVYNCARCNTGVYIITELDLACARSYPTALPPPPEQRHRAKEVTLKVLQDETQRFKEENRRYQEERRRYYESDSNERHNRRMHTSLSYIKNKPLPKSPRRQQPDRYRSPSQAYLPYHRSRADSSPQQNIIRNQSFSIRKEPRGPKYALPRQFARHETAPSFTSSRSTLVSESDSQVTKYLHSEDRRKAIFADDSMYALNIPLEYKFPPVDIKVRNGRTYF